MAAVNAAYAILSHPVRRAEYDRLQPAVRAAKAGVRRQDRPASAAPSTPPKYGRGAPQPGRLPDWYIFLGVDPRADTGTIIEALRRLGWDIRAASYTPEDEERLLLQVRDAADTLTNSRVRAVYDRALDGHPPPAGEYPAFHLDYYSFLGLRRGASEERIAEQVTKLSGRCRRNSREYREIEAAWRTLRDPDRRAAYDRSLGH
jgi:DnaJ-class molecular chaperone